MGLLRRLSKRQGGSSFYSFVATWRALASISYKNHSYDSCDFLILLRSKTVSAKYCNSTNNFHCSLAPQHKLQLVKHRYGVCFDVTVISINGYPFHDFDKVSPCGSVGALVICESTSKLVSSIPEGGHELCWSRYQSSFSSAQDRIPFWDYFGRACIGIQRDV